jgi:hypothetical protein
MAQVAPTGRTILFVSHQMSQIRRLCTRCIWIDRSQVRMDGPAGEVVSAYEAAQMDSEEETSGHSFLSWEIAGQKQTLRDGFREVTFQMQLRLAEPISQGHLGVGILNESNFTVVGWGFDGIHLPAGLQEISLKVPLLPLRPGVYTLVCSLFDRGNNLTGGQLVDNWYATPPLTVDTAPLTHPQDRWAGVLNVPAELQVSEAVAAGQLRGHRRLEDEFTEATNVHGEANQYGCDRMRVGTNHIRNFQSQSGARVKVRSTSIPSDCSASGVLPRGVFLRAGSGALGSAFMPLSWPRHCRPITGW